MNNTVADSESKDLITSILTKALVAFEDCMTLAGKVLALVGKAVDILF